MTKTKIQRETVRISTDGIYRGASVHIPYPLEHSDFLKLTKITSFVPIWAHSFFAGTSVFCLTVISKWIDNRYFNGHSNISSTELITLALLAFLAVIFEVLYFVLPSEKKKTIKKIEKHFEENLPQAAGFDND